MTGSDNTNRRLAGPVTIGETVFLKVKRCRLCNLCNTDRNPIREGPSAVEARSQALAARAAQLRVGDAEPTPDGTNNFVDAHNYVSETWWRTWNAKPPDCELQALAWATTTGTVTENWSDSTAPKVWHTSHDDWTFTSLKWDRKDNVVEEVWHRRVQQRTSNDSNTMPPQ